MIRRLSALLVVIALGFASYVAFVPRTSAAPPWPSPNQLNADVYEVPGYPSPTLQTLNPMTQRIKAGLRTVRFRYLVMPGCSDGNMHATLLASRASTTAVTGITFIEDEFAYDMTVRANCGTSFVVICSSGATACLGRNWPYSCDIDASTTMATFYDLSQISIWEHEFDGHCLSTAEEGYCKVVSQLCPYVFASVSGFVSYMNTGADSRHDWPQSDKDRWERTMYSLSFTQQPDCTAIPLGGDLRFEPCLLGGRVVNSAGWTYSPNLDVWYQPNGNAEWGSCNLVDRDCWNIRANEWVFQGSHLYDPVGSVHSYPPLP